MRPLLKTNLIVAAVTVINIIGVLILIWSSYHGLDLTDESYYYLSYLYHTGSARPLLYFTYIYNAFFGWADLNIIQIRLLRIALVLAASCLLAWALLPLFKSTGLSIQPHEKSLFFQLAFSGALGTMAWGPLTLSYNSFSTVFICVQIALWLLITYRHWQQKWLYYILLAAFAFVSGLSIFNKAPNVLILMLLLVISGYRYLHREQRPMGRLVASILCFSGAFYLAMPVITKSFQPAFLIDFALRILKAGGGERHGFAVLMSRYSDHFISELVVIAPYLICAITLLLIAWIFKRLAVKSRRWHYLLMLLSLLPLSLLVYNRSYYLGGMPYRNTFYGIYPVLMVYLIVFSGIHEMAKKRKLMLVAIALSVMPVIGGLGTNNTLTAQSVFYLPFILMGLFLLLQALPYKAVLPVGILFLILMVNTQVITGVVYHPYRSCAALTENRNQADAVSISGLYIMKHQARISARLQFVREAPEKNLFVFSHQLGLCLLLDKRPYGDAWIDARNKEDMARFSVNCEDIAPGDIIFAVPEGQPMPPKVDAFLRERSIRFPEAYLRVDTLRWHECYTDKDFIIDIYLPKK